MTRELAKHWVLSIGLVVGGIRKTSIFQANFNIVSLDNLFVLSEPQFSQLELGDDISYLLGLSGNLREYL